MKPLRIALLALALVTVAPPALACLWDRDTLAAELDGIPDVSRIAVGRFERNPPLYYELRLRRAMDHLGEHPEDLDAFDDAAVALDRLGRPSEAIELMERKLKLLDSVVTGDGPVDHRYRTLANLGTFHAHRWIKRGGDRTDLTDLERGRELVARAIEENPDAHFGRERYQLRILEFLLEPVVWDNRSELPNVLGLKHRMAMEDSDYLEEQGMPDAVEGLSGLVTMGAAWRSVDVFHALAVALEIDGRNSAAYVVRKRIDELIAEGRGSMVPGAPTGAELRKLINGRHSLLMMDKRARLDEWFELARSRAAEWRKDREGYLLQRLERGIHPDTEPGFWDEFEPVNEHPIVTAKDGASPDQNAWGAEAQGGSRAQDSDEVLGPENEAKRAKSRSRSSE